MVEQEGQTDTETTENSFTDGLQKYGLLNYAMLYAKAAYTPLSKVFDEQVMLVFTVCNREIEINKSEQQRLKHW